MLLCSKIAVIMLLTLYDYAYQNATMNTTFMLGFLEHLAFDKYPRGIKAT